MRYELRIERVRFQGSDPVQMPDGWEPIAAELDDEGMGATVILMRQATSRRRRRRGNGPAPMIPGPSPVRPMP